MITGCGFSSITLKELREHGFTAGGDGYVYSHICPPGRRGRGKWDVDHRKKRAEVSV